MESLLPFARKAPAGCPIVFVPRFGETPPRQQPDEKATAQGGKDRGYWILPDPRFAALNGTRGCFFDLVQRTNGRVF